MGWFSRCVSSVSAFVGSVASSVSRGFEKAKNIAGQALGWIAENAEKVVGNVKKVWAAAKPYVNKMVVFLDAAAKLAPYPWLKGALSVLSKGLAALTAFENSPVARKVDAAIKWAIDIAKRWQKRREQNPNQQNVEIGSEDLSEAELLEAKSHQSTFRTVEREFATDNDRHAYELAAALNDFEISRADLKKALINEPENFEHYLRLRATQKLLNMAEKRFIAARSLDDLSLDDLFLVRIASDLIKVNPEFNNDAAMRLDRILKEVYGRALAPFVFEELVASWALRAKELTREWEQSSKNISKEKILLKNLVLAKNIQGSLSAEEDSLMQQLQVEVPNHQVKLDAILRELNGVEIYVGAVEGFIQLLEKNEKELEVEGKEYLIDEGASVGKLLIKCAEENILFESLPLDEQYVINDYSNIFKAESGLRVERVLESIS